MSNTGLTFTWDGEDIKDQAPAGAHVRVNSVYRPLIYPVTRHKIQIPGRAGSWDFGGGVKQDYEITVDITIFGDTEEAVMDCVEVLSDFLSGKKDLIFSDKPDVTHTAEIYQGASLTHEGWGNVVRGTIVFECDGG